MIEKLSSFIVVFVLLKWLFSILGWYSRDGTDHMYRRHLDKLWDELHKISLFALTTKALQRLVERIRQSFISLRRSAVLFFLIALCINAISFVLAVGTGHLLEGHASSVWGGVAYAFGDGDIVKNILIGLPPAVAGAMFDVLSLFITWALVKRAASAGSVRQLMLHLSLDVTLTCIACAWACAVFLIACTLLSRKTLLEMAMAVFQGTELKSLMVMFIILGISSALPTFIYGFIVLTLVTFAALPESIERVLRKAIYLVTTDNKPVLSQLGTLFGIVVGFVAGIAK